MNQFLDILQMPATQNALLASALISIACGIVGVYVVVNRMVFISGGISHAALGGVGIGILLGINNLIFATMGFSILVAISMGYAQERYRERFDTLVGAIWAIGMALGILLIESSASDGEAELESYLFGSIESISQSDLLLMGFVIVLIILVTVLFYKELLAISFDKTFAAIMNVPVSIINYLLLGLVAVTVVIMMKAVGLILVIAMLSIPASIAGRFTRELHKMMGLAIIFALIFSIVGLLIAQLTELPPGPTMVLIAGVGYLSSFVIRKR